MEIQKEKFPNTRERFSMVNRLWQGLSNKDKEPYNGIVRKQVEKYTVELQQWFKV